MSKKMVMINERSMTPIGRTIRRTGAIKGSVIRVRKRMIAKDHVHLRVGLLVAIDVVEPLDTTIGQPAIAVAMEI